MTHQNTGSEVDVWNGQSVQDIFEAFCKLSESERRSFCQSHKPTSLLGNIPYVYVEDQEGYCIAEIEGTFVIVSRNALISLHFENQILSNHFTPIDIETPIDVLGYELKPVSDINGRYGYAFGLGDYFCFFGDQDNPYSTLPKEEKVTFMTLFRVDNMTAPVTSMVFEPPGALTQAVDKADLQVLIHGSPS